MTVIVYKNKTMYADSQATRNDDTIASLNVKKLRKNKHRIIGCAGEKWICDDVVKLTNLQDIEKFAKNLRGGIFTRILRWVVREEYNVTGIIATQDDQHVVIIRHDCEFEKIKVDDGAFISIGSGGTSAGDYYNNNSLTDNVMKECVSAAIDAKKCCGGKITKVELK